MGVYAPISTNRKPISPQTGLIWRRGGGAISAGYGRTKGAPHRRLHVDAAPGVGSAAAGLHDSLEGGQVLLVGPAHRGDHHGSGDPAEAGRFATVAESHPGVTVAHRLP